mmetsp:Transcript_7178/g.18694  ORF Transcript_7178/g.18694 Transcript_7178/m.18694 type:complete len:360 (+) Transcript_7178:3-1082(+)
MLANALAPPPALAVLNSPNVQIPRSADVALRRSIPAFNPVAANVQSKLEEVAFLLRIPQRKPWGSMTSNSAAVAEALADRPALLAGIKDDQMEAAGALADDMDANLKRLNIAIAGKDADKTSIRVAQLLQDISKLEVMQAPGLPYIVSSQYNTLPRLEGRATVALEVAKADGSAAFINTEKGTREKTASIEITVDGYSAPITAGRFLLNVKAGKYSGQPLQASFQSLVAGQPGQSALPLEILRAGEFEPEYKFPLDVQNGELPILPLSINGAVAMTHIQGREDFVDGEQFFVFKFDKTQAGLAGLSFDEGTFGVFGYVTRGLSIASSLENGDIIKSATVVNGEEKLVVPPPTDSAEASP